MNLEQNLRYKNKIDLYFEVGRFQVKTISTAEELAQAFLLRYQVFQVEMIGLENKIGYDHDEFDLISDHLAIFDTKTNKMVATCRLNCSLFSNQFYSAQEFSCQQLLELKDIKLELGRVCVEKDFRKGVILMILWRALAAYMLKTESKILFGCGSVQTESPLDAVLIYKYLKEEKNVQNHLDIHPIGKFKSQEFDQLLNSVALTEDERLKAQNLLPSLCRSYFDMGCYTPSAPAFDHDFKCIDFLTVLEVNKLDPKLRQKMLGT